MAAIVDENLPLSTNVKADAPPKAKKGGGHKVLKHREHVLLRPDTYVGATEQQEADMIALRADLSFQRKQREAVEDEVRRVRSMSISGENSQRTLLSQLLR